MSSDQTKPPVESYTDAAAAAPTKQFGVGTYLLTAATDVFTQACTVGSGIIVARMVGPEGRGVLGAAILWPTLFLYTGIFGLNRVIGQAAAREKSLGPLSRTTVLLGVGISALTAAAAYLSLEHLIPTEKLDNVLLPATLALLLIPATQTMLLFSAIAQGSGNFRLLNLGRAIQFPVYVLLLVVLWVSGAIHVAWVVGAMVVSIGVVAISYLIAYTPSMIREPGRYRAGKLIGGTWQFGLGAVGNEVYQRIDLTLLFWFLADNDMGYYLAALSAASVICRIMFGIGTVGFTECAKAPPRQGFAIVANLYRKAVAAWILAGIPLGILMPWLLPLVFGERFSPSVPIAIVLLLGIGPFGTITMLNSCMLGQGKPMLGLFSRVVGMVVMAVLGCCLLQFGPVGIAIAYVCTQSTAMLILLALICRYYDDSSASLLIPRPADVKMILGLLPRAYRRIFPNRE